MDIELVFDGDWDPMQNTFELPGSLILGIELPGLLQGVLKSDLGQTVGLLLSLIPDTTELETVESLTNWCAITALYDKISGVHLGTPVERHSHL